MEHAAVRDGCLDRHRCDGASFADKRGSMAISGGICRRQRARNDVPFPARQLR
jgi:hypothetical protein